MNTETPEPIEDAVDDQVVEEAVDTPETEEAADTDTFPRSVVEKLRKENADYRTRAKDRDDLARRLHNALVEASGRLADASDLPFDETHLNDPEALTGAIEALLAQKPHLASRRPIGDIGQGVSGASETIDLAGLLRARA